MKITINMGKIDGYGNGRKSCAAEFEVALSEKQPGLPVFSVCVDVWNHHHTHVIMTGQYNIDKIVPMINDDLRPKAEFIETMWKRYYPKYGSAGIYPPIPDYDLKAIKEFMATRVVPAWWDAEVCSEYNSSAEKACTAYQQLLSSKDKER